MRVCVYGLRHLGCVTAACLASAGHEVFGLDLDEDRVRRLQDGSTPLDEPGLAERLGAGLSAGRLSFTTDAVRALRGAEVLWVTFDTPVDQHDDADVAWVRGRLEEIAGEIAPGTLVLVSSQVPVGFTAALERDWAGRGLRFACSPENLRLGRAVSDFERPERIVVGVRDDRDREPLLTLLGHFSERMVWMSVESAEMTKHALNAFLAASVAFANEVAQVCEAVGADAREVERGLRSDGRVGPGAYLSPGAPFAGGTLARDVRFLLGLGARHRVPTALIDAVLESNAEHGARLREKVWQVLNGAPDPVAAVLGLTYKPGTRTLRRSAAVELCRWLRGQGVTVRAHDPAVPEVPPELRGLDVVLCASPLQALDGADVAVLATPWPDYRGLGAEDFLGAMRRARVIDPNGFLASALSAEPRLTYIAAGRPAAPAGER